MSEYIDKNELLTTIGEKNGRIPLWLDEILMKCKAVDVAPMVHGEWLNIDGDYTFAACSICKTAYEVATEEEAEKGLWDAFMCSYHYCPNCGAKMDGGSET